MPTAKVRRDLPVTAVVDVNGIVHVTYSLIFGRPDDPPLPPWSGTGPWPHQDPIDAPVPAGSILSGAFIFTTQNANQDVSAAMWIRQDGVEVPGSRVDLSGKSGDDKVYSKTVDVEFTNKAGQ